MSRQWKKCARRSNFARLEPERAVLESKSYRGSSKLKSQKASINYVISPRRWFRTPSGKNQHSASFCSHLHLSSLIMEKTRTTMVVRVFLVAHWGTYGYGYCGSPVSRVRAKPWLPRVTLVRCLSFAPHPCRERACPFRLL